MTQITELQEELQHTEDTDYSVPQQSELQYLKQTADRMGIEYPNNITVAKLKAKIDAHIVEADKLAEASGITTSRTDSLAKQLIDKAHKLVRFQLIVNNPNKQRWTGEYFTAGNDLIPPKARFVPFNADGGIWHAEQIILDLMRKRKYTMIPEVKDTDRRGRGTQDYNRVQLLPEFTIIELPPLTPEELAEIRARQDATGAIDRE